MNVMAQAHKDCKARIAAGNPNRYADLFRVALRQAHKEYKAMQKQTPEQAYFTKLIEQAEQRIAELQAITETTGFIVVVGDDIRLPVCELSAKWVRVEDCSIYTNVEDARHWASKVRNGNGEVGQIVTKAGQIWWEIKEQKSLIETLKTALKG